MGQKANILTLRKNINKSNSYATNPKTFLNTNEYITTLKRSLEKKNVILISHSFDTTKGNTFDLSLNLFYKTRKVQRYLKKKLKIKLKVLKKKTSRKRLYRRKQHFLWAKKKKIWLKRKPIRVQKKKIKETNKKEKIRKEIANIDNRIEKIALKFEKKKKRMLKKHKNIFKLTIIKEKDIYLNRKIKSWEDILKFTIKDIKGKLKLDNDVIKKATNFIKEVTDYKKELKEEEKKKEWTELQEVCKERINDKTNELLIKKSLVKYFFWLKISKKKMDNHIEKLCNYKKQILSKLEAYEKWVSRVVVSKKNIRKCVWRNWKKIKILHRRKTFKKWISKIKRNKHKKIFLRKKSSKDIKPTKFLNTLTKNLPNNALIINKITVLNKQINMKVVQIAHCSLRYFKRSLFSRRFDLYYDFLKLTSLLITKKVKIEVYNAILGRIFKFLMKRSHNKFFNFLKKLAHLLTRSSTIGGIKFVINGKLKGKLRANSLKLEVGNIALQTITSDIGFSKVHINTLYGCFGLKTWIKYN